MESDCGTSLAEDRLKSFLSQLQSESGILERLVYKNKNQHRRCPYFQALLKVRRDLKLLQSAGLEEIFNVVFPIIDGKRPAQKAYLSKRQKKNDRGKHNYHDRLLGAARLLSQMADPILQAATQISFLLAKSFFTGFSLTIMALLARFRVLVQQMLLDVVLVFNKVCTLSQKKQSVKLSHEGIEAFREYCPLTADIVTLECVWKEDKFLLLERTDNSNRLNQIDDQEVVHIEPVIQYETLPLINEDEDTNHEETTQKNPENLLLDTQIKDSMSLDEQATKIIGCSNDENTNSSPVKEDPAHFEEKIRLSDSCIPTSAPLNHANESSNKVAFVPVKVSRLSVPDISQPNKKMKLDPKNNPFLDLHAIIDEEED